MNRYQDAINELLEIIASRIPQEHIAYPIKAYIVGGVASYLYTQARASDDIDMIISHRIDLPQNLFALYQKDGLFEKLVFDDTYNDTLGLMHEDYPDRANLYKTIDKKFEVYILHPVDLVISKLLRLSDNDEQDIKALIQRNLVDKNKLLELANDAISVGVGFNINSAKNNLELVLEYF
ncbi:MAG: hypothetical protein JXQ76_03715 [Campylobacterales bacterium]|nr:hypothetical protein [Campylobacterales bacterium]